MSARTCKGCSGEIAAEKHRSAQFCSKACSHRLRNKAWAAAHPEGHRAWVAAHPDAVRAKGRAWQVRNGEDGVTYRAAAARRAIYGSTIPNRSGRGRFAAARALGYRSGLEVTIAKQLEEAGVAAGYESIKLKYTTPAKAHTYTPDWVLPNGVTVESKGVFTSADRAKHLLIKAQHPDLDLRFVFTRSATPICKGSKTSQADWCNAHGFQYADKLIPLSWLQE